MGERVYQAVLSGFEAQTNDIKPVRIDFKKMAELREFHKDQLFAGISWQSQKATWRFHRSVQRYLSYIDKGNIDLKKEFAETHLTFGSTIDFSRPWIRKLAVMALVRGRIDEEQSRKYFVFNGKNVILHYRELSWGDFQNLLEEYDGDNGIQISNISRQFQTATNIYISPLINESTFIEKSFEKLKSSLFEVQAIRFEPGFINLEN